MSPPRKMSGLELDLAVAQLLDGPGLVPVLDSMARYAEARQVSALLHGHVDLAKGWGVLQEAFEDLQGGDQGEG